MSIPQIRVGASEHLAITDGGFAVSGVTYKSLNPAIATVDSTGTVTGVAVGMTLLVSTNPADGTVTNSEIQVIPSNGVVPAHTYASALTIIFPVDLDQFSVDSTASYTRTYHSGSEADTAVSGGKLNLNGANLIGTWVKTYSGLIQSVSADFVASAGTNSLPGLVVSTNTGGTAFISMAIQALGGEAKVTSNTAEGEFGGTEEYYTAPGGGIINTTPGAVNTGKIVLNYITNHILFYINDQLFFTYTGISNLTTAAPKRAGILLDSSNHDAVSIDNLAITHA